MAMKYKYDKDTDYKALMDRAAQNGDYAAAAVYEQQRNAKIAGEGLDRPETADYARYLPYEVTRDYDDSSRAQAQALVQQPDDAYQAEIDRMLEQLLGAEFEYDPASDAALDAYRKAYLREADLAAENALGRGAARTNGRASTAAVAAAQQAGNYYRAKAADRLPELERLAYEMYQGSRDSARDTLETLLDLRGEASDARWKRIEALLDMDDAAYERYAAGVRSDREKAAAAEKEAGQAAGAAAADARTQIALILRAGGTVPAALWARSGYDPATIAALKAGKG